MSDHGDRNRKIEMLFRRYGPLVYRRALKILRNESLAEEATQDIFVRVVKGIERFDGRSKMSTWLFQVTTNHCLNHIRNQSRRRELWRDEVMPQAEQKGQTVKEVDQILLKQLLGTAEPELAQAAVCVFIEGMTGQEAAQVLGVSRRTVINRLERFKAWAQENMDGSAQARPPPDTG